MAPRAAPRLDDEAGRLAALRRYDILDSGIEAEFEQIIELVQHVLDMPAAAVSLIDSDRQWCKARRGFIAREVPRDLSFCHHVISGPVGLAIEDASLDPRFADSPFVVGAPRVRSYLGEPLRTPDGYNVGVLCVVSSEVRRFSDEERETLRRFSEIVVSHMELRQLASRDSLTGTLTRRAFDQEAYNAIEAFRRDGRVRAAAILDIDHFKRINDVHGHGCGDDVLARLADALQSALGGAGVIGRLGGEEFGILLDLADRAAIAATAEALRGAVSATRVASAAELRVTASIGVAMLTPGVKTADAWLHRADTALYAAKHDGRDRIVFLD